MTNPATGLFKQVAYKREVTYGVIPVAAAAQALRRISSTVDLSKDTYLSAEIKTSFQKSDFRHGVHHVKGKLSMDLQAKTFSDFFALALKRDFAIITPITAASITITGAGPVWTVARAAGSFLTDGIKVGHVIQLSVGTFNAANISKNLVVLSVVALSVTILVVNGTAMVAEGPIAASTVTVIGKTTFIPNTGQTDNSFSLEHFYSDLTKSEVFNGCKVDQLTINLPPTGMATVDADVVGQDLTTASAQYFTAPTAPTTTKSMAAVNGIIRVGGVVYAIITGATLTINPMLSGNAVVGSNVVPFQFPGSVDVSGQLTAYFIDTVLRDAFIAETEIDVLMVFTADNTATSDFLSFHMPRVKLGSANKNDGEGGLVQTISFQALQALTGGAGIQTEQTTIQINDSAA